MTRCCADGIRDRLMRQGRRRDAGTRHAMHVPNTHATPNTPAVSESVRVSHATKQSQRNS